MQRIKQFSAILFAVVMLISFGMPMVMASDNVYSSDFSTPSSLNDFNIVGGNASIENGKLKIDSAGNAAAVLKTRKFKNFTLETDLNLAGGNAFGQVGVWFRIGAADNIEAGSYNVSFQFDVGGDKVQDKIQAGYFPWDESKVDWMNKLNIADVTDNRTEPIKLKVVMIGGTVSVYVNGAYKGSYYAYNKDSKYEEGYVGLGGWNFTAEFDNFKVTALEDDAKPVAGFELESNPLYSFDFSSDLDDKWIVSESEKIKVSDGKLTFTGTTGDQYALFKTGITKEAYCVEVKFVHTAGNIGIVNRAAVKDSVFNAMAYTFDGGLTKLTQYPYEEFVITKPYEVEPGSENVMKIYVNGNTTDVFINDVHVLGYTGGTADGDLVGLLGWNAQCTFDDLKVYEVKAGVTPPTQAPTTKPSNNNNNPKTGYTVLPISVFAALLGATTTMITRKKSSK